MPSVIPALDAAFQGGHVHLVDVPIDYSENRRVLMDELRAKVSASQKEAALAWETFMQIKAAVLDRMGAEPPYAQSNPLRIATLELDPPGRNEVLVRVAAAGLCHSDLSVINGDRPRPMPMAL